MKNSNKYIDQIADLEEKLKHARKSVDTKELLIARQSSTIQKLRRQNHELRHDRLSRLQLWSIDLVSDDGQKIIYDLINHLLANEEIDD